MRAEHLASRFERCGPPASLSFGVSGGMKTLARSVILILAIVMLAGCKVERGVVIDFVNPLFDLHCGPVTLIAFSDETVLHIGSTYLMLRLPFYVPVIACIFLAVALRVMIQRRRHAKPR